MKTLLLSISVPAAAFLGVHFSSQDEAPEATGSVVGRVVFEGERPEAAPDLTIGVKESKGCVHGDETMDATDRSLLISDAGGVADVVLTISDRSREAVAPTEPVIIDQYGCRFEPHITVVPVGTTVRYKNSDAVNHNVHTYPVKNKQMNNTIAAGASDEQTLEKAEAIRISCDIHPWMNSYLLVTDDPVYAVSDADGSFKLEGLPPGTYKVNYWHEKLGKGKSEEVTVVAGKAASLELKVGSSSKSGGRKRGRKRG